MYYSVFKSKFWDYFKEAALFFSLIQSMCVVFCFNLSENKNY